MITKNKFEKAAAALYRKSKKTIEMFTSHGGKPVTHSNLALHLSALQHALNMLEPHVRPWLGEISNAPTNTIEKWFEHGEGEGEEQPQLEAPQ